MFLRKLSVAVIFCIYACSVAAPQGATTEGVVITFSVSGSVAEQGVLVISDAPFERGFVQSHIASIQAVFRPSEPPRNLNACYTIGNARAQLTHIRKGENRSYLLQVEFMTDAGVAYSFKLESRGVVSGHGGLYATDVEPSDKIAGTHKRTDDAVAECARMLPTGT
jgi:hypothetical protein